MEDTEATPFYKDFLSTFNLGTPEEFGRQYYATWGALIDQYYNQYKDIPNAERITIEEAAAKADKTLKLKLQMLNPNKKGFIDWYNLKFKNELTSTQLKEMNNWNAYLTDKQKKDLKKAEIEYGNRLQTFLNNESKYAKEYNYDKLKAMIKDEAKRDNIFRGKKKVVGFKGN